MLASSKSESKGSNSKSSKISPPKILLPSVRAKSKHAAASAENTSKEKVDSKQKIAFDKKKIETIPVSTKQLESNRVSEEKTNLWKKLFGKKNNSFDSRISAKDLEEAFASDSAQLKLLETSGKKSFQISQQSNSDAPFAQSTDPTSSAQIASSAQITSSLSLTSSPKPTNSNQSNASAQQKTNFKSSQVMQPSENLSSSELKLTDLMNSNNFSNSVHTAVHSKPFGLTRNEKVLEKSGDKNNSKNTSKNFFGLKKKNTFNEISSSKNSLTTVSDDKNTDKNSEDEPRQAFSSDKKIVETYNFQSNKMPITVNVCDVKGEFVKLYDVSISSISDNTEIIIDKIREELVTAVSLGITDITSQKDPKEIESSFVETISILVQKYFPDIDDIQAEFLISYLIMKTIGLGQVEILKDDANLEEIAINSASEPIWVYHRKYAWMKTNVVLKSEDQIKHYASMIGRKVGRQITVLEPLLDAHLEEGDRANATLIPISNRGNTITLRKFSRDPFTITHFLQLGTMNAYAASLIWISMQYELSAIIAGGTASGKTAALNVLATFIPPNQRVISIEDTRELLLPKFLHWVPLSTRLPNPEGKGGISMEDLLVNSLRMRPDRILVGEVRRQREAETLFEAIHTGHSCYGTFHANTAEETGRRLTNPPINVPPIMLPAISLIITQFRNRRTGKRRTFQIAEIAEDSKINVLLQYDPNKDTLVHKSESVALFKTLSLYTGFTKQELLADIKEKESVLNYLVKQNIKTVDGVGKILAEYYTNKENLMKYIKANKKFDE